MVVRYIPIKRYAKAKNSPALGAKKQAVICGRWSDQLIVSAWRMSDNNSNSENRPTQSLSRGPERKYALLF